MSPLTFGRFRGVCLRIAERLSARHNLLQYDCVTVDIAGFCALPEPNNRSPEDFRRRPQHQPVQRLVRRQGRRMDGKHVEPVVGDLNIEPLIDQAVVALQGPMTQIHCVQSINQSIN